MWWLEFLSVALFAMGWWPCQGCVSGPGTTNNCSLYCALNTSPDEITIVLGTGATNNGWCTDGNCDNMAGTYILPEQASCSYYLDTGTMYHRDDNTTPTTCTSTTSPRVQVDFGKWVSGPDTGKYNVTAKIFVTTPNESPVWRKTFTTSIPDCCDIISAATALTYTGVFGGEECDFTAASLTVQCT